MKNLIEYIMLFCVLILFFPSNYLTIIYIAINLMLIIGTLLIYKSKNKEKESLKRQINITYFVSLFGILLINIIMKNEMLNLLLGTIFLIFYIAQFIYSLVKKEYSFKKCFLKESLIFDIYSLGYLICLTAQLQHYIS